MSASDDAIDSTGSEHPQEPRGRTSRRSFLRGASIAGAGAVVGAAAAATTDRTALAYELPSLPKWGWAAPEDRHQHVKHGHVGVNWNIDTDKKIIALTFDDGPMPNWTPMVYDTLEKADVPATFFLVGERALANAKLIQGRTARHEYGNHTWNHKNLALLGADEAYDEIARAHDVIEKVTGKEPKHLRPPYGHLGGTTLMAANNLGYDITLWSLQMVESEYVANPPGLTTYIVDSTLPGAILLAHDTGANDRLVALNQLAPMVAGLRAKGFEFLTVSELLAENASQLQGDPAAPAPTPTPGVPAPTDTPAPPAPTPSPSA